ncbi:LysM peptidoglycan-binding domain-containing protein [uncultured Pseudokineococcus sp.]|uniref:LysM peptidoglycan-binding domain-containing protein n=1 Tax=uncultured Pseudokineococcus sp. TaxID=1642928 RepID=UPI0026047EAD|nr:LysM peptidoglycan-binding domain-containing protein [uncultured Pseudokineococcus sp.]
MTTPPALAPAGTDAPHATAPTTATASAHGTPRRRRGRHLSLVVAAALGAGGLLPAAAAASAEEAPRADERGRPAGGTAAAPRPEAPREEVQLAAPVAVVAAATGRTYVVQRGDTVSGIARRSGLSQQEVVAANGLDDRGSIRVGQVLRLDRAAAAAAPGGGTYVVQPGDTVSGIAARTGTSQRAIIEANGLDSRGSLRAGQELRLSGGKGAAAPAAPGRSAAPAGGTYTVRPGDTVGAIAARTGTSQRAIIEANGLDSRASIRAGQVLRLSGGKGAAAPAPAAPRASGTYTVRPGDSLSTIARRQGTTVSALRQVNPGVGADGLIRVGQRLSVPGSSASPAPSSSAPVPSTFLGRSYPSSTTRAATANRDALAARSVPSRDQMRQMVRDTARRWGVDPALAQAVAFQESGFNMRSVSPANAVGVMQVVPSSGEWASQLSGQRIDLLDPQDNVTAGVVILRSLTRSAPDQATAIAGYYQGLGSVRSRGMYADTRRYVAGIQTLMRQYR